jgi:hypothetical protein
MWKIAKAIPGGMRAEQRFFASVNIANSTMSITLSAVSINIVYFQVGA